MTLNIIFTNNAMPARNPAVRLVDSRAAMTDPAPPETASTALEHLRSLPAFQVDPDFREWRAPTGVLASAAGVSSTFRALRMRSVVDAADDGSVRFEAWRHPRASGALLAAVLGALLYAALSASGFSTAPIVLIVVLAAFYVPTALLPSYRVSGKIADGRVQARLHVRGLFGRRRAFEGRLRFYLER